MLSMRKFNYRFVILVLMGMNIYDNYAQGYMMDTPIMGWSSWNTYRVDINEALIKKQTDAMVYNGFKEVGYQFVNIDDGFFGWRDEKGQLHSHPERFPNGMKVLADYIHSKGLKAGIYSEAGANTCGAIWDSDKNGIGVGLYGFEHQDASLFFNEWGYDFIKIDYCGAGQQLELDEEERYKEIVNAIREVSSRNISLNICRWAYPGTWVKNYARSWRISEDISPNWESVKHIISKNLYLSAFAGEGHYNDMDMLEIGRGLSEVEEETHFGMWCIMCSPLLIGCDLTTIPEKSMDLLKNKELIAVNQDPLGLQAYVVQHKGDGYVLVKDLETRQGTKRAVALYNPSGKMCSFSVPLETLELAGVAEIRDLVRRKNQGIVKDVIEYDVEPHGVKFLCVNAEKRLERVVYEAEQAYLNDFDDLAKRSRSVAFMPFKDASGGMTVCNLGGHKKNYAEWNDVYSKKGGRYEMKIFYVPAEKKQYSVIDHKIEVSVNGERFSFSNLEKERSKGVMSVAFEIDLKPGYNIIRIGSRYTWSPDIDCFTLKPILQD